jgi:hypothetical protein
MTVILDAPAGLDRLANLTFDRTVDRTLLHRRALSEVFLTDSQQVHERAYLAAAQLPALHAYYTDHVRADALDPLLLLECARQAETYGAHAYFGVPLGTSFVLRRWSMTLRAGRSRPSGPAELRMAVQTNSARHILGALRNLTYDVDLFLGGHGLGNVQIGVAYLPRHAYRAVRARRRAGNAPPTSEGLIAADVALSRPAVPVVAPARVGRSLPANVVLYEPLFGSDTVNAQIRVPLAHPSMFDHPQDHLPGMVMMEAARQLGLLVVHADHGAAPRSVELVGFTATFSQYAELDEATVVRAHRAVDSVGAYAELVDGQVALDVTFHQRNEVIAEASLFFAVADGRDSREAAR